MHVFSFLPKTCFILLKFDYKNFDFWEGRLFLYGLFGRLVFRRLVLDKVFNCSLNLEYFSTPLGLVIQIFMRMKMDRMDKISMEAIMRAGFENINIFLIHFVYRNNVTFEITELVQTKSQGVMLATNSCLVWS